MQTLNQLLTEIDGFQPTSGVVFMAATNRAALLDPALMRAGRFDRKITIPRPDADARLAILQVHARRHLLAADVDLRQLAQDVPGLVGADLANLLNEAALAAVRDGSTEIADFHVQVRCVLVGARCPEILFVVEHCYCVSQWKRSRTGLPCGYSAIRDCAAAWV